jgi:NAD+ kinase
VRIAILPNLTRNGSRECIAQIIDILIAFNAQIYTISEYKKILNDDRLFFLEKIEEVVEKCDISITIGGDGTITHAAKYAVLAQKPILGINLGRVGFVATLERDDLCKLELLFLGKYFINRRAMISAHVYDQDSTHKKTFYALNDVVISQIEAVKISDFIMFYKKEKFYYRSDGLIFSTPTGSTAYSLSAGGPVIDPEISCILFSQICPHSVCQRPTIFSSSSEFAVRAHSPKADKKLAVIVDGRVVCEFSWREIVKVSLFDKCLELISFEKQNFYGNFKKKFISPVD